MWLLLALAGCVPLTAARPLERGQHEIGATLGGPMISAFGAVMPIPLLVVQGRSGLPRLADRAFDVHYGVNLTGFGWGVVGVHTGASWLVVAQDRGVPAVALVDRLYVASNFADPGVEKGSRGVWAADQIEVVASWEVGHALLYASLSQYLDFGSPALTLTPLAGVSIDPGRPGGFRLALEVRYWAANVTPTTDRVDWVTAGPGALGASLGCSWVVGGAR